MVKTENCLYICRYVWYVRIPYMHSALFVRDAIFPHCTLGSCILLAQETGLERLNSGSQRNRDLKTVRKGRHY